MRLAALKRNRSGDKLFQFSELLATSLLGILTVATNNDSLVWKYCGLNTFSAEFHGLEFFWDQPNNEPAKLTIGPNGYIEDNRSGSYGFAELANAIWAQSKRRE